MRTQVVENSAGKFEFIVDKSVIEVCETFAQAISVEEGFLEDRTPDFYTKKGRDHAE